MKARFYLRLFTVFISFFVLAESTHATTTETVNTMLPEHASFFDQEEFTVITKYESKKGYRKKFRKALRTYVKLANTDPDNVMAEAFHEQENPNIFWVIERWENKIALENLSRNGKLKLLRFLSEKKLVQPVKPIYARDLEPISKSDWQRTSAQEDTPMVIMLFVDSKAGTAQRFKEVYHTAMPQFRSEPGVINYQLSQLEADSTQFVTYEKFRSEAAFQYHLNFPPIQPVIDYLNTSIKKQPFQTGLHRLIEFAPKKRK